MYTLLRFESLSAVCGVHQFESGSAGSGTFQHNLRWNYVDCSRELYTVFATREGLLLLLFEHFGTGCGFQCDQCCVLG